MEDPRFNPTAMGAVSQACLALCHWVLATDSFLGAYRSAGPQRRALLNGQQVVARTAATIVALTEQQRMATVQRQGSALLLDRERQALAQLTSVNMTLHRRREAAAEVLDMLQVPARVWQEQAKALENVTLPVALNMLACAAVMVYAGGFSPARRQELVQRILAAIAPIAASVPGPSSDRATLSNSSINPSVTPSPAMSPLPGIRETPATPEGKGPKEKTPLKAPTIEAIADGLFNNKGPGALANLLQILSYRECSEDVAEMDEKDGRLLSRRFARDEHVRASCLMAENTTRWPLICDPEGEGYRWVVEREQSRGLVISNSLAPDLEVCGFFVLQKVGLHSLTRVFIIARVDGGHGARTAVVGTLACGGDPCVPGSGHPNGLCPHGTRKCVAARRQCWLGGRERGRRH